ncbi:hypothetical protein RJ640_016778 [Escallonia rubra]|uniref:Biotin carboxyl carrier protein of acetyl-CoA carboxylase n=1 Tax=Escallonia rubra TaxID=112253 RepID=A0AA88QSZ4_9ASTE|nr:hypothetical protein RJ640_016778 [Escallonia rubra]
MASSVAASASVAKTTPNPSSYLPLCHHSPSKLSFRLSPKSTKLRFSSKSLQSSRNPSTVVKTQLNEVRFSQWFSLEDLFSDFRSFMNMLFEPSVAFKVAVDGSSNAAPTPSTKSDDKPTNEASPAALASEESISEFIAQVANLVKLVDSRDIVELQLKQLDCELLIRKKEALPQPPSSSPIVMMQSGYPAAAAPPAYQAAPAPSAPSAPAASSAAAPGPPPPAAKSSSSLPPLKCPMAGTFYRSPAPSEPPFVKVGDKVQKGQVLCIIEAMKLMNEIEVRLLFPVHCTFVGYKLLKLHSCLTTVSFLITFCSL